jgi:hypothetical protein
MNSRKIIMLLLLPLLASAQDTSHNRQSVRVVVKPALLPHMQPQQKTRSVAHNDTLTIESNDLRSQNDSLLMLINDELANSRALEQQNKQLTETNRNLKNELEAVRNDQLQTSHTSSVLLIFNILAGIILLVSLLWIFTRKRGSPAASDEVPFTGVLRKVPDHVDTRMERIEKLGKLRDKGLLTEEEFQLQKKQILG